MARNKVSLGKRITLSLKRRFSPKDLAELAEINAVSTVILSIDRTDIKGYVQDVVEADLGNRRVRVGNPVRYGANYINPDESREAIKVELRYAEEALKERQISYQIAS